MNVRFNVVSGKNLWWNTTCAMFVGFKDRSTFTQYAEARKVAKERRGHVINVSSYTRVVERMKGGGVFDIIDAKPTNAGNLPPILVSAIERALDRGNMVEIDTVEEGN